jgi:hypothetical protein
MLTLVRFSVSWVVPKNSSKKAVRNCLLRWWICTVRWCELPSKSPGCRIDSCRLSATACLSLCEPKLGAVTDEVLKTLGVTGLGGWSLFAISVCYTKSYCSNKKKNWSRPLHTKFSPYTLSSSGDEIWRVTRPSSQASSLCCCKEGIECLQSVIMFSPRKLHWYTNLRHLLL